jgi:hypothetical protein
MINDQLVLEALQRAPKDWVDTAEQAQLRACLVSILSGWDDLGTLSVSSDLITLIQGQLLTSIANLRRLSCQSARTHMKPRDISAGTGQSIQTVSRLLNEARDVE